MYILPNGNGSLITANRKFVGTFEDGYLNGEGKEFNK